MSLDFNKICRVCLESKNNTYNIFKSYYSKKNILYSQMLYKCTEIKPFEGDGLPINICRECSRQLKRAYAFNVLCVESDKKLISIVENKPTDFTKLDNSKDVKTEVESNEIKVEDTGLEGRNGELENDIKNEPNYDDDDWDAEDDNTVLGEIKSRKCEDQISLDTLEEQLVERPKKKRGRKKRDELVVYSTHLDSKLPHQCDICGKFLSTKSNLKAHKICHTDLRPFKCSTCPAAFRGYSALFQHKKVHTGETPYHCEYCTKQFSRRTSLINHVRIHTGEKLYSCDICFKTFAQSAQLSIHVKRHKGDKTYLCQDCGKGFPIKSDLRVHQRIHNGEKPYSCHLCTKTFTTSGNLSIHVRIHNKEIRYHCAECDRGFVTCSAYSVHLKRHKGQRDYSCECGKTFYTSSALKQHRVVHTGEKKYQCKVCERKFSQTSHLSRHFKKEHVKPNMPVPSSDTYKVVIPQPVFTLVGPDRTVKCEYTL